MYEFLWFLSGAFLYKLFSKLLGLYQLFAFFHEIQLQIIAMLIASSKDLEGAATIKYEMLAESDTSPEERETLQLIDESIISSWKKASVINLHRVAPKSFQPLINFETWDDMVDYYKQSTKRL